MKRSSRWTGVALAAALAGGLARAQTTERVSVTTGGAEGDSESRHSSISADGRFVAFNSLATNFVAGDMNATYDVFVHDRQSGTTECVSVDSGGVLGNAQSHTASISADGRFVAFVSHASNLVPGDTNGFFDVFVRDRLSGTTELVSVGSGGALGDFVSGAPSTSADGRFVAFESRATNLVPGDTGAFYDVFVRDRLSGTTERVSVDSGGAQGNLHSTAPSISADGRFVAFVGAASNLVPGDTNGLPDIFVRDRQNGTTERASVSSAGVQADFSTLPPTISADGRFVAFFGTATTLVPGDTNLAFDVFVRDRQSGTTERVSVATDGAQANSSSQDPSISADGRFVTFHGFASNLIEGDTNGAWDVFVRDRHSGTTERVSLTTGGTQADSTSEYASISADGRFVSFHSLAANLLAGDANGTWDVFVRDRGGPPPWSPFCSGDGSGTACPCGNAGVTGHGCGQSLNSSGAILTASGSASLGGDTLVLAGGAMPNATALYIQGTSQQVGGLGSVFGDGLRCVAGTLVRLGTKTNVGGSSQYPSGADAPVSVRGLVTSAGIRTYQVWYRNAAAFCTAATFNLTNGLQVQWGP